MIAYLAEEAASGRGMTLVEFFTSAGIGALICGVAVAIINGFFSRGGKRADAAKALIEANLEFANSVTGQYNRVLDELLLLKKVVIALTDTIDEILPEMTGVPPEMKKRLRDANAAAKIAT